ncbi:hypothetical protein LSAT2_031452 [Lamellibrachia satsuma]|nr:hypothetical protein LSAT2_031452 [Lamellibrachia satsuma]
MLLAQQGVTSRSRHSLIGGRCMVRRKVLTPRNCRLSICYVGLHDIALSTITSPRQYTWTTWHDMEY